MARCRFCQTPIDQLLVDLGETPLANSLVEADQLDRPDPRYPLRVGVCSQCLLVQTLYDKTPEAIFHDRYVYYSSFSESWLAHAKGYVEQMIPALGLGAEHRVVEIASNDGYLLRHFVAAGIPALGVEPSEGVASAAQALGVESRRAFFGRALAEEMVQAGEQADLLIANNVLAHVPDLNDFIAGLKRLLKPGGLLTLEFPHLLQLMQQSQFDTIYHEHFSYFSLLALQRIFPHHGLQIERVERLPTHGGSLRIHARHLDEVGQVDKSVPQLIHMERHYGLDQLACYRAFSSQVVETIQALQQFLQQAQQQGKRVVGYGAAAKGNTLLNCCGVTAEQIAYVVDRNPQKQGRWMPGSRIPIRQPETIFQTKPDYLLILPWNFKQEIMQQMAGISHWGGRFVVPIPTTTLC
uniref:Putative SAM-dependent methyltransferase n=1 Tax=Magnetococcus massalia (strain MO-1) TaxID=451514 RepID=A0A1S7LI42_MAGMO|nr:putative SAM-dependent methyltransferase [Candidatus Magnetococcus massalia]